MLQVFNWLASAFAWLGSFIVNTGKDYKTLFDQQLIFINTLTKQLDEAKCLAEELQEKADERLGTIFELRAQIVEKEFQIKALRKKRRDGGE